jgi:acyl-CoA oxidase
MGIHNFIVPLRDLHTHALLPGVVTRDIGPKIAFAGMDNGCLELHAVRIPRANLAQRFVRVTRQGVWSRVEGTHSKAAYVTMMQVGGYSEKKTWFLGRAGWGGGDGVIHAHG